MKIGLNINLKTEPFSLMVFCFSGLMVIFIYFLDPLVFYFILFSGFGQVDQLDPFVFISLSVQ